jgi:DNA-directed RNA polymerase subunit RPC12/RpoP
MDEPDPLRSEPITRIGGAHEEERRIRRSGRLGTGTLACERCDAPVAPPGRSLSPADLVSCPFCSHRAPVRDFLSLVRPPRPARVEVRVVQRTR